MLYRFIVHPAYIIVGFFAFSLMSAHVGHTATNSNPSSMFPNNVEIDQNSGSIYVGRDAQGDEVVRVTPPRQPMTPQPVIPYIIPQVDVPWTPNLGPRPPRPPYQPGYPGPVPPQRPFPPGVLPPDAGTPGRPPGMIPGIPSQPSRPTPPNWRPSPPPGVFPPPGNMLPPSNTRPSLPGRPSGNVNGNGPQGFPPPPGWNPPTSNPRPPRR